MTIVKITDAATEPVSLAEAKAWLRVDLDDEDTLISALIKATRLSAEHIMQRTLITTVLELVVDRFPPALRLERPKVLSVVSVKYLDELGIEQTLDPTDYVLDADNAPGYLVPAPDKAWPATLGRVNAVRVRYTAGYGPNAADVPESIKQWMRLHIEHYYRNRGAVVTNAVQSLPFADGLLDEGRVWLM